MDTNIYFQKWDGKTDSHTHLKKAIRKHLKTQGKTCPGTLSVCKDKKFAKPYIKELPDIHFSISHSGEWWCCAVAETEVGLDIQEQCIRNREKLARRFFHPDEISWLETRGFDQFYRIWTYKESYVKYTGVGLVNGMDYFSVVNPNTNTLGVTDAFQTELPFHKNFWMVLTAKNPVTSKILSLP